MNMEFEWDENKEAINFRKHGVRFTEATEAFDDENAVELFDDTHSDDEVRFQIVGATNSRLLFVAYTERSGKTRIISAREADAKEVNIYHEHNR
ncbi:MAG: BrnT family toxin [Pyrinomonadaceae bacterium]|nr:BrnT family toxin [Pyrinomonadaceae bacterium]